MARSAQLIRLSKRFDAIPLKVREAVAPALEKSGTELVGTMKALAPEDTGLLKHSLTVTPGGQSTPAYSQPGGSSLVPVGAVAVTAGNTHVRYPHLVEYGTAEAAAQPFFWPAYRLLRKRMVARLKRSMRKAVREGWEA